MLIYKCTNQLNGKVYIGQTSVSLKSRIQNHLGTLNRQTRFHNALKKHGGDNFTWEVIEQCDSREALSEREIYWIGFYQAETRSKGMNMTKGGEGNTRHTEKFKQDLAERNRRLFTGKRLSEEHRRKIGDASRGHKMLETVRQSLRERVGDQNPYYGKTHNEEIRARLRVIQRGSGNGNAKYSFNIISPFGQEFLGVPILSQFCKAHGLPARNVASAIYAGSPAYYGWQITKVRLRCRQASNTSEGFVSERGGHGALFRINKLIGSNK